MRGKKVLILATALGLSGAFAVAPAFAATDTGVGGIGAACTDFAVSSASDADWRTEDGAPTPSADGLVFSTPTASDKQNWFHNRTVPLAGVTGLGYSLSNTGGPQAAYDLEVFTTGVPGSFATFVYEPYVNGAPLGGTGSIETYTSIEQGKWWSSKIANPAPGSQAQPITLSALSEMYPQALVIANGLGQGKNNAGSVTTVHSVTFGCVTTTFSDALSTVCEPDAVASTNLDADGWTAFGDGDVTWVDGGIRIDVPGDWAEAGVQHDVDGTLADMGSVVDFDATSSQYLGVHLTLSNGADLVYEKEASYNGKWWSTTALNVASGLGYATFDTFAHIVAANPTLGVTAVRVLYTNPAAASTTVNSVTVGCTTSTFGYEEPAATPTPDPTTTSPATPSTSAPTTAAPTAGATAGPAEGDLTTTNHSGVTVTGSFVPGGTITVRVDASYSGQTLGAYVFSTPTFLGTRTVSASGTFTAQLPANLTAGAHRVVVTAADGSIVGWAAITVTRPAALASTGASLLAPGLVAAIALIAGATLVLVRRNARA